MAQEMNQVVTTAPALTGTLTICMLCLLALVGFKLRWFRARIKMGGPPSQQSTLETGVYRRTFSDDLAPRRVPRASTKILSQYRSMPDLTIDSSQIPQESRNVYQPKTKVEKPKAKASIFQKRKQPETLQAPLMNGTTKPSSPEQSRNPLVQEVKDTSIPKMKVNTPESSRSSSPIYDTADPQQSKTTPRISPLEVHNPAPLSESQNLRELDFIPIQNSRLGTPIPSRSSSPILFGEAPLNHRADRMDSLFMAPEVGVPFAKGNPLPLWANQVRESTEDQKKKYLSKEIPYQEKDQRKTSVFPLYEEFDT